MHSSSDADRRRAGRGWTAAGYTGLAGFAALEAAVRRRGRASSLATSTADRGTTRSLTVASVAAALTPDLFRRARLLPPAVAVVGVAVQAAGLVLRGRAMSVLGSSYTRTLRTTRRQRIVTAGPYRWVRHPGYAGSLLVWIGFGLTTRRLPVITSVAALMSGAYGRRIVVEERLLNHDLRGYRAYSARTARLVPGLW